MHWNIMEASGKATIVSHSVRTYVELELYLQTCEAIDIVEYPSPLAFLPIYYSYSLSSIWQLNLILNKGG